MTFQLSIKMVGFFIVTNDRKKEIVMGRKYYPEEFKSKVISVFKSGTSMAQTARMFKISQTAVRNWTRKFDDKDKKENSTSYSPEEKRRVIRYKIENNMDFDELSDETGVNKNTLQTWYDHYFYEIVQEIICENNHRKPKNQKLRNQKLNRENWNFVGTGGYWS